MPARAPRTKEVQVQGSRLSAKTTAKARGEESSIATTPKVEKRSIGNRHQLQRPRTKNAIPLAQQPTATSGNKMLEVRGE
eukprot:scaffold256529_cov28-Tisochrysis_lutea.AAC.1